MSKPQKGKGSHDSLSTTQRRGTATPHTTITIKETQQDRANRHVLVKKKNPKKEKSYLRRSELNQKSSTPPRRLVKGSSEGGRKEMERWTGRQGPSKAIQRDHVLSWWGKKEEVLRRHEGKGGAPDPKWNASRTSSNFAGKTALENVS